MQNLAKTHPMWKYFYELTQIPRGSGDMEKVSDYIVSFAKEHNFRYIQDEARNVIIFKDGQNGGEKKDPVILQGHLDMVCQKVSGKEIDFKKDGLSVYVDNGYVKADGTTLGADNGIAVAMTLSILADNTISHPPIEAVFTTDEEIGMIGATKLSVDSLKGKRMINIDSEDESVITVSCAGGSDFLIEVPIERETKKGNILKLTVKGLKGGHSGVEINSGRENANALMARILNHLLTLTDFYLIKVSGGDKGNAIPCLTEAEVLVTEDIEKELLEYAEIIKKEISSHEEGFVFKIENLGVCEREVIKTPDINSLIYLLLMAPTGVISMSREIEGLVETSLNLGILKTEEDKISLLFALRSNKQTAMKFLEDKLKLYAKCVPCNIKTGGHYPPWEYRENSCLEKLYKEKYTKKTGKDIRVEAIHAGLECGVFASKIKDFDCISVGPEMHDIHTPNERLSIKSSENLYEIILAVLSDM